MKRLFAGICMFLCLMAALAGCGAAGTGGLPGFGGNPGGPAGSGESSAAESGAGQSMSAEAVLRGEQLALTLHGYCMSEISAEDLQALHGLNDLEGAGKILEGLRRAAEKTEVTPRYHAEDITVLLPTTEEDRKSGLTPRELAGTVHGWQDDAGKFHILLSAGNEIFWICWSEGEKNAALITGKWGD